MLNRIRELSEYEKFFYLIEKEAPLNICSTITFYKNYEIEFLKVAISEALSEEQLIFSVIQNSHFICPENAGIAFETHQIFTDHLIDELSVYRFEEGPFVRCDFISDDSHTVNTLILTCSHIISDAVSIFNPLIQKLCDKFIGKQSIRANWLTPTPAEDLLPRKVGRCYTGDYTKISLVEDVNFSCLKTSRLVLDLELKNLKLSAKNLGVSTLSLMNAMITKVFYENTQVDSFLYQHVVNVRLDHTRRSLRTYAAQPSFCSHGVSINHPIFNLNSKDIPELAIEMDKITKSPFDYFSFDSFMAFIKHKNKQLAIGTFDLQIKIPSFSFSSAGTFNHSAASSIIKRVNISASTHHFSRTRLNGFVCYAVCGNTVSITLHHEASALNNSEKQMLSEQLYKFSKSIL